MKKLILFSILILGVFAWRLGIPRPAPPRVLPAATVANQATLSIDFGSGQPVSALLPVSGSPTAFTLLSTAARLHSLPLESKQYDFGLMIQSINGYANSTDKAWIYFVNSKSAAVSADKYPVQSGDVIEWKYVKPQF